MAEREPDRTPAEQILREKLRDNPGVGRPLPSRARLAQRSVENYLKGGNPPRWMERVAEIDQRVARERRALAQAQRELRERCGGDAAAFARRWRAEAEARARGREYDELNALIRQHNEWFPVERNLAVNPLTGEHVPVHGRSHVRPELSAEWVLEQFPA